MTKSLFSTKESLILTFAETVVGKTAASPTISIRSPQGLEQNKTTLKKKKSFRKSRLFGTDSEAPASPVGSFIENRRTPRIFPLIGGMPANPSRRLESVASPIRAADVTKTS